jgi:hypothetical protein
LKFILLEEVVFAPDVHGLSLKMEIIGPIGKYPGGEILPRLSKYCCDYGERHE